MPDGIYHTVEEADCVSSVAEKHGFFWETIWEHPENRQLKELRTNPNVLLAGDVLFLPERTEKLEDGATEQRHRFRKKGVPALVRFRLLREGRPRASVRFILNIDGNLKEGVTDKQGRLSARIPADAQQASLKLIEGDRCEVYPIQLGAMDPVTERSGAIKRLQNLGFLDSGIEAGGVERALRSFQSQQGLKATGRLDKATQDALRQAHGS